MDFLSIFNSPLPIKHFKATKRQVYSWWYKNTYSENIRDWSRTFINMFPCPDIIIKGIESGSFLYYAKPVILIEEK